MASDLASPRWTGTPADFQSARDIQVGEYRARWSERWAMADAVKRNCAAPRLTEPTKRPANVNAPIDRRERLGGLLNFYYRRAA